MAQLVGAEAARQRHVPAIDEDLVGAREGAVQDARPQAVAVASAPLTCGKTRSSGPTSWTWPCGRRARRGGWADRDLAQPGLGLRAPDRDPLVGEVDVAPEKVAELLCSRPGQDQGGEDHLAFGAVATRLPVELRTGVEERLDLGWRVEVDRPTGRLLKKALATGGGVLADVAIFEGDGEQPRRKRIVLLIVGGESGRRTCP